MWRVNISWWSEMPGKSIVHASKSQDNQLFRCSTRSQMGQWLSFRSKSEFLLPSLTIICKNWMARAAAAVRISKITIVGRECFEKRYRNGHWLGADVIKGLQREEDHIIPQRISELPKPGQTYPRRCGIQILEAPVRVCEVSVWRVTRLWPDESFGGGWSDK
jgi:hypothetical protein